MVLDAVDGLVARHLNTTSIPGSIYDILADRIIENTFFIFFVANQLFNIWFAILILVRGLIIDAIRAIFATTGKTAFGLTTLHSSKWAINIACSRISRGLYNTTKMLTFIAFSALVDANNMLVYLVDDIWLAKFGYILLWVTTIICIIRAVPVVYESVKINRHLTSPNSLIFRAF